MTSEQMKNPYAFEIALKKQKKKKPYQAKSSPIRPYQLEITRGKKAEEQACRFLKEQGLLFLARNMACPFGEIDLLMKEGETLVVIEVRQRSYLRYGQAIETIDNKKQNKLIRSLEYLLQHIAIHFFNGHIPNYRFDLVTLDQEQLQWTKNVIFIKKKR
ncbi:UPF0102 protein mma_0204-like [Globicephala melas]|uniref:UPF0102 protein mma_0204-like n=1 Tax=Globicephala melas TaxID=9731 RepID=UPI00293D36DC|nr:UPF0102 protein mma_0204-like [Globicephala melas]